MKKNKLFSELAVNYAGYLLVVKIHLCLCAIKEDICSNLCYSPSTAYKLLLHVEST